MDIIYWIWLTQLKGLGPVLVRRLLNAFGQPKAVFEAELPELMAVDGIGCKIAEGIIEHHELDKAKRILEQTEKENIHILTMNHDKYRTIAEQYGKMPAVLYYKGTIRENCLGVGIVGSRRCSNYGKKVAMEAATFLAEHQIPVISGMAKGIDSYAHIACLKAKGYTIAFLGNGLDRCYPKEHATLMEAIIEQGAVISEHPPGVKPRPEFFPRRNYFISSWSKKLLVPEASEKSGALITAALAKEQGKEIFAAPAEIYRPTGKGTNRLIVNGATMYLEPIQLLDEPVCLDYVPHDTQNAIRQKSKLNPIEKKIISVLQTETEPKTIEELACLSGMSQVNLIEPLMMLELEGIIQNVGGGRYIVCN